MNKRMSTLICILALLSGVSGQDFSLVTPDVELDSCQPEEELSGVMRSDIECVTRASPGAQVATFHTDTGRCVRSARCNLLTLTSGVANVRPVSVKKFHQTAADRKLLFSVKAGSGVNSNGSYASSAQCNNSVLLLPHGQLPTVQLWRSCWLDRLAELVRRLSLSELVLHVIKDGSDVMNITFSAIGDGLDLWSWFRKDKVVSYWPASLGIESKTFSMFSIQGVYMNDSQNNKEAIRTFYINILFNYCNGDIGYLVVMDAETICPWADGQPMPQILFNVNDSKPWAQSPGLADYLQITVQ